MKTEEMNNEKCSVLASRQIRDDISQLRSHTTAPGAAGGANECAILIERQG